MLTFGSSTGVIVTSPFAEVTVGAVGLTFTVAVTSSLVPSLYVTVTVACFAPGVDVSSVPSFQVNSASVGKLEVFDILSLAAGLLFFSTVFATDVGL